MKNEEPLSAKDGRERMRVHYTADVSVETLDNRESRGLLRDIGLNSLYVVVDQKEGDTLIFDEEVNVKVALQADGSSLTIKLHGYVARMDKEGFVVQFSKPLRWWPIFIMFPDLSEE